MEFCNTVAEGYAYICKKKLRHSNPMRHILLAAFLSLLVCSCGGDHRHSHGEGEEMEDGHNHPSTFLTKAQIEDFGIEFETIAPSRFHDIVKTSGSIDMAGSAGYTVTAKKSGIVTLANGVNEGMQVKTGQQLGSISSQNIQGGDADMASRANLKAAQAEYERLKPLHAEGLVTTSTFREAERAYEEAKALNVKGPGVALLTSDRDGILASLLVKNGDYVDAGAPVAMVVKNSNRVLKAELPSRLAKHLPHISGANIISETGELIKLDQHEGKRISDSEASNIQNGYIPVYFSFSGNSYSLPGGYVEVFLLCEGRDNVISVPVDALVELQGNKYLYVVDENHDFEKRLVTTGASDGERVEIISGINTGEKIVSKGAAIVRMAEISAIAPPAHSHNH